MKLKTKIRRARKSIEETEVLFDSIKEELKCKIKFEFIIVFLPGDGICVLRESGNHTGMPIDDVLDLIDNEGEVTDQNFLDIC